ncbi:acetate kinase [Monaibacterium marinum]|uniref:Acetate kinase n=1 Tax=Pontivivens marinum TaxID=1690039 RepID=A0A2C9CQG0_9RHOB|nr:acetate/propionate family kinase [Monaibacterium marinum]SOH93574.1 acetate kinase [Monaibacterium marinum]
MSAQFLILNVGSSSIKFALYDAVNPEQRPQLSGQISDSRSAPKIKVSGMLSGDVNTDPLAEAILTASHEEMAALLLDWLMAQDALGEITAVGHRVVHGGSVFSIPVIITAEVLSQLQDLIPLAPLHQPFSIAAMRAVSTCNPDIPQVACFDTAYHRSQPRLNQLYPIPRALMDEGLVSYGFHGLSYDYISSVLPDYLGAGADGRVVVAHLGNGASMCGIHHGRSVATTMGFTALHGLMMGQRSGTIDAGIILHLMQQKGYSADDIQQLLYQESGLLGVSGISSNMQDLDGNTHPHAVEAVDLFCYRAASECASLAVALGGLDAIVFTGGIGENAADIRRGICTRLEWLGVTLDEQANAAGATQISLPDAKVTALTIPTNEDLVIARATYDLLQ